jgi:hypothetical protein
MYGSLWFSFYAGWKGFTVWFRALLVSEGAAHWAATCRFLTVMRCPLAVHGAQISLKPAAKLGMHVRPVTRPFAAAGTRSCLVLCAA